MCAGNTLPKSFVRTLAAFRQHQVGSSQGAELAGASLPAPRLNRSSVNHSQMLTLSVGSNDFTGEIPHQYGSLNNLAFLFLGVHTFMLAGGSRHCVMTLIGPSSGQLARRNYPGFPSQLHEVSHNFFCIRHSSFTRSTRATCSLEALKVYSNRLTGPLPHKWSPVGSRTCRCYSGAAVDKPHTRRCLVKL